MGDMVPKVEYMKRGLNGGKRAVSGEFFPSPAFSAEWKRCTQEQITQALIIKQHVRCNVEEGWREGEKCSRVYINAL